MPSRSEERHKQKAEGEEKKVCFGLKTFLGSQSEGRPKPSVHLKGKEKENDGVDVEGGKEKENVDVDVEDEGKEATIRATAKSMFDLFSQEEGDVQSQMIVSQVEFSLIDLEKC